MFYSQSGQDAWVDKILRSKTDGYYIEIGAYNGVDTSNTYFFQKERNWKGICVECDPSSFNSLVKVRDSVNFWAYATDYDGVFENTGVPARKLNTILEQAGAPEYIDYLSIDIEGMEYSVLHAIDFDKWRIGVMTVEHNLYCWGPENKNRNFDVLSKNGYVRVVEDALVLDPNPEWYMKPNEDWFVHESILEKVDLS
jgi:hypothetical protein